MDHNRRRGIMLAFFGMLGVSTDSFFIRLADIDGFDVTFWVGVFAAIATFAYVRIAEGVQPLREVARGGWPLWLAGALQAGSTTMFVLAVTNTSVSNVVVIVAAAPIIAAALSRVILGERTSRRVWLAIGVVLVGIVIVVSGSLGEGNLGGDLFAIGAITQFGFSLVLLRSHPGIHRGVMVGLGGVGMSLLAAVPAVMWGHGAKTWIALILMGAVFGPAARVAIAAAPKYLPAAEVGLFTPVETVAASLWAWLFFDEAPVTTTYIGGAIVVGGVLWGMWRPNRHKMATA
ncbi:MAG: DMT family transporter [Acidimicrobiales bacterium]